MVSFLLERILKYVLPKLRGSDVYDSLIHVSFTILRLTTVSLSESHEERMDKDIILVFTWEDKMEDWVIIWHLILFENEIGHSR